MARQMLQAGKEVDMLTDDEVGKHFAKFEPILKQLERAEDYGIFSIDEIFIANAAGVLVPQLNEQAMYRCPPRYYVSLHRIEVNAPGATMVTPLVGAGLFAGLFMNDPSVYSNQFYMWPNATGGQIAPSVITEGSRSAKIMRPGETLYFAGGGFTAGQNISIRCQIQIAPLTKAMEGHRA